MSYDYTLGYSIDYVEQFLSEPWASNFGLKEEDIAEYFMNTATKTIINKWGLTKNSLLNTYIPELKHQLGGGWFMFLAKCIYEFGGAGNWINHYSYDTKSTALGCLRDDCKIIRKSLNKENVLCTSAPEISEPTNWSEWGRMNKFYKNCKKGSIASSYMSLTFAGNAWTYAKQWCLDSSQAYFNDPYVQIIELIKKYGGNPHNGHAKSPAGSASTNHKKSKNPNKDTTKTKKIAIPNITEAKGGVYLSSSRFAKLGGLLVFTRYKNWLNISINTSAFSNLTKKEVKQANKNAKTIATSKNDKKTDSEKVASIMKQIDNLGGRQYLYTNVRPQQDPRVSGQGDCSGFVGWCIRKVYPTLWNKGYVNTATLHSGFKALNKVVWSGSINEFQSSEMKKVKKGDLINFSNTPYFGAGLYSHIGIMCGDGENAAFFNQHGGWDNGTYTEYKLSIAYHISMYKLYSQHLQYVEVLRP